MVLVTEPVFDEQGQILYIIGAAIDLQRPRFFGQLASLTFGKTGYLFMLTSDGTILHHPDPERILVNVHAEPGKPVLKPRWPRSRASRAGPKARPSAGWRPCSPTSGCNRPTGSSGPCIRSRKR
ncbi:cache domain-containing protein [Massilia sp. H-1]|nr:cache domain-containing protein [Massilia sp. H-1]